MVSSNFGWRNRKTKMVCTLAREPEPGNDGIPREIISEEMIERLALLGMDIARINMSHGDVEEHAIVIERVRRVARRFGIPIAIMIDTPGPEYRTRETTPERLILEKGQVITLTSRIIKGDQSIVPVAPPGIHLDASVGGSISLGDGEVELIVRRVEGEDVRCVVNMGGAVTERCGVTMPGKQISLPFLDDEGKAVLKFAAEQQAEFVALSFVNSANDVKTARKYLCEICASAQIVSKIETGKAYEDFDDILNASDAIMVARGDLGVNLPLRRVPLIQKSLITKCNAAGKPVITATQMLESLMRSEAATRPEMTDIYNAIRDGTDALMLSGETAIGWYPRIAVNTMSEAAALYESALPYEDKSDLTVRLRIDDAIAYAAARTADQIDAKLIVVFTESGSSAVRVSKYRPRSWILALTPDEFIRRQLTLSWGITPVTVDRPESGDDIFEIAMNQARKIRGLEHGDSIVIVAGLPMGTRGSTNLLRVAQLAEDDS